MKPRGLLIALALSVALNLFLAGLWAGGRLSPGRGEDRAGPGGLRPPAAALAELPPQRRRELRRVMRQASRDARASAEGVRDSRREAARAIAAEPYDRAGAEAALARARSREAEVRVRVEGVILDYAGQLPPGDRAAVAAAVERGLGARRATRPERR